uniref:5'-nucleotidase n=1 Tax=Branchiostoma floridae TaxID=7739 RepID=C3YY08_BRAFL|eukprot:XP_002598955.1 hypothetical protein BRAFLDRAFT_221780 [Branchiostoma floridae]
MNAGKVAAFALCLWVASCLTFDLSILHTNDCHAGIEQTDGNGGSCGDCRGAIAGKCFGGVARRLTKAKGTTRRTESESNVLLLDAGDQFQRTLWFYYYS